MGLSVVFARKIHGELLMGVGLIDETVPPAGAIAAFNQTPNQARRQAQGPKHLMAIAASRTTPNSRGYTGGYTGD